MRDDWKKPVPTPALSRVDAERLVRAAFPRSRVVVVHAVAGGLANATYRVDLAERRPVCLRL